MTSFLLLCLFFSVFVDFVFFKELCLNVPIASFEGLVNLGKLSGKGALLFLLF